MRNRTFDILKAIAIYLVVLGHVLDFYGLNQYPLISFLHMPIFFFVSGYFLYYSINKYSFQVLFKKKVKTLLVYCIIDI